MITLSISSLFNPDLALHAAQLLAAALVSGDVTPRFASVAGNVEYAAKIEIYDHRPGLVLGLFRLMPQELGITCAWYADDDYQGCVKQHPLFNLGG